LRRWEELRPEFDERGVKIVTVSTDTVGELQAGRPKHRLGATMLSDRELEVTDRFGLRNRGRHTGVPGGAKALPVPTSILADAEGKIVWMDQSENYQRRSDPDVVLGALRANLG
jgi:peroxiredoxin